MSWLILTLPLTPALADTALAEPRVVVTSKPIHALVAGVMEGVGSPRVLIEGAGSPHTYAMRPSDAKAVAGADVFFRVSEALEPFTAKLVQSLPNRVRVVTLAEAPGLKLLDMREGGAFEVHDHDEQAHRHSRAKKKDAHDHGKAAHDEGESDPHVWLDPENAKAMVAETVRVLSEASPADAPRLNANGKALSAKIDALAADIERTTKPLAGKPFIVFHDAFQYFEQRFGLTAAGSITVRPDVPPSARRLSELRRKIRSLDAVCVFAEPSFEPKLVRTLIEGTKARSGTLDAEGAALPAGPDLYFTLMRSIARSMHECLSD
ncbi:MAG TPA: zinc ABC transporter substrate-binding protein [Hyphomicrobiaceae bacterium]|nr:zinc ABC transporter substrate-binding protein [Hyphomicrobiaceae bacterium]